MGIDFQGCFIRRLVSPGSRAKGSGLRIIPGFGWKHIDKESISDGPEDIEDVKKCMDSLVITFVR